MARGGRTRERDGPERRCAVTGARGAPEGLIRFALSPDGVVAPDVAGRLPGRGVWVTAARGAVDKAASRGAFSRGFRQAATAPEGLSDLVEALLVKRVQETLGLARRAGLAVTGYEKVRARLKRGPAAALIAASDGAADGRGKLSALAGRTPRIESLTGDELGLAFGRDFVIHAALDEGGAADRVILESRRLDGFRKPASAAAPQARSANLCFSGSPDGGRSA